MFFKNVRKIRKTKFNQNLVQSYVRKRKVN